MGSTTSSKMEIKVFCFASCSSSYWDPESFPICVFSFALSFLSKSHFVHARSFGRLGFQERETGYEHIRIYGGLADCCSSRASLTGMRRKKDFVDREELSRGSRADGIWSHDGMRRDDGRDKGGCFDVSVTTIDDQRAWAYIWFSGECAACTSDDQPSSKE